MLVLLLWQMLAQPPTSNCLSSSYSSSYRFAPLQLLLLLFILLLLLLLLLLQPTTEACFLTAPPLTASISTAPPSTVPLPTAHHTSYIVLHIIQLASALLLLSFTKKNSFLSCITYTISPAELRNISCIEDLAPDNIVSVSATRYLHVQNVQLVTCKKDDGMYQIF
jgi:hypothetical protein